MITTCPWINDKKCVFDLAIANEEEDDDVISVQEATMELPRSSTTKTRPRQIFKNSPPPKKMTTAPVQSQTTPNNNALWMQQQWMMGQVGHWMMGQPGPWMMGQQFAAPGCSHNKPLQPNQTKGQR